MFKHSTKVPRLYKTAAKVAKDAKEGIGSIKNLVYEQKKHPNIKAIYALVTTLFQRYDELESLLKRSQFFNKETRADPWLSKILIVEILWGKKRLPGSSIPEKTVQAYEQIFKAHLSDISSIKESDNEGDVKPRYVRINTLFISLDDAIEGFRNEGWNLCKFFEKTDYKGFLQKVTSLGEGEFLVDIHVQNLLIFPPKTEFYKHPAYKNGSLILQDKASCLPVHILNPPPGSTVLDMCAAPGMKTTQLAAVMNNQGTIYAVERDQKRFETLNKIVESSGADCIKTVNRDVMDCGDADFPGVQYIIVDPSCSGSGLTDRLEIDVEKNKMRIEKLAGFQIKILRSALTRYPDAKRVVYSTCSIYPEENEDVVRQVLETNTTFKLVPAKQFVNDAWQNFGSSDYGDIGKYCLYAKPNEDFTNGFFVAVFDRLEDGENNQFFNTKIYNFKKHVQSQENRKRRNQEANRDAYDTKNKKFKNKKSQRNDEEVCDINEKKKEPHKDKNEDNNIENETLADDIVNEKPKLGDTVRKKKKKHAAVSEGTETDVSKVTSRKAENSESFDEVFTKTGSGKDKEKMEASTDVFLKKSKKRELNDERTECGNSTVEEVKKNKKKKDKKLQDEIVDNDIEINVEFIKRKKKKKITETTDAGAEKYNEVEEEENNVGVAEDDLLGSKKKRKKNKDLSNDLNDMEPVVENNVESAIENKKKKLKRQENKQVETEDNDKIANFDIKVKNKKKKSLKSEENKGHNDGETVFNEIDSTIKKRKKKSSK